MIKWHVLCYVYFTTVKEIYISYIYICTHMKKNLQLWILALQRLYKISEDSPVAKM